MESWGGVSDISDILLISALSPGPPERVDRIWQRRAEAERGELLLAQLAEPAEM